VSRPKLVGRTRVSCHEPIPIPSRSGCGRAAFAGEHGDRGRPRRAHAARRGRRRR